MQTLQIQLGFSFFSELPVIQGANFAADCTSRFTTNNYNKANFIKIIYSVGQQNCKMYHTVLINHKTYKCKDKHTSLLQENLSCSLWVSLKPNMKNIFCNFL